MRQLTLDTETTGLLPEKGHRVIEIGVVEIVKRQITNNNFHTFCNPKRDIDQGAFEVHGISSEFLSDKPEFSSVAGDFLEFVKDSELFIHNAPFDLGFLNHELKLNGVKTKIDDLCPVIDTLELSKEQRPGTMHNLDALCRRFGVDTSARTRHGALLDAQILAQVYLAMTGGQSNLFQEDLSNEPQMTSSSMISKNKSNKEKIKVILANKEETELHNNYFKT